MDQKITTLQRPGWAETCGASVPVDPMDSTANGVLKAKGKEKSVESHHLPRAAELYAFIFLFLLLLLFFDCALLGWVFL